MAWTIEYSKLAERQLKKLPKDVENRIRTFMAERVSPRPDPLVLGKRLSGPYENRIRFRVGDYRVICSPRKQILLILVVEVAHRREVYR